MCERVCVSVCLFGSGCITGCLCEGVHVAVLVCGCGHVYGCVSVSVC